MVRTDLHNTGPLRYLFFNQPTIILMQATCHPVTFLKYKSDPKPQEGIPQSDTKRLFQPHFKPYPFPSSLCSSATLGLDYLQLLKHPLHFPTLMPFYFPAALSGLASSAWLLQRYLFILLEITQMLLPLISYCWKHSPSSWCSHSTLFIIHFELKLIINNQWLFYLTGL